MKLNELIQPWVQDNVPDCVIETLCNDSRTIKAGSLFLAYPGAVSDGRLFIEQAIKAGAAAVIYEPNNWPLNHPLPVLPTVIPITNLADNLAALANRFYQSPSKKLTITGVTGTNGKTTIAYQLAQAHVLLNNKAAYVGTLGQGMPDRLQSLANTTPDALCLQQLLYNYHHQGIKQVCMEVSSHALVQGRVAEVEFKQAIFTNLTHDHLDYHATMAAYADAKAKLFACPSLQTAVINADDASAKLMSAAIPRGCQLLTYGIKTKAAVKAVDWQISLTGSTVKVISPWGESEFTSKSLGFFNLYNALAIFASLLAHGYDLAQVIAVMSKINAAPGRMEVITREPCIIVDYAHTPDALKNVLLTLTHLKKGRIIIVFGCGGDRDKSKRPLMGKIAANHADIVIITSDNPRSENPQQIIEAIAQGINAANAIVYQILNRKAAIAKAISLASPQDIILIAGKGHESYQQIGTINYPFSDREVVKQLI